MPARVAVKDGDVVVYRRNPDLYGLMKVCEVRADKRLMCRIDSPLEGKYSYEVFDRSEVNVRIVAPVPETTP